MFVYQSHYEIVFFLQVEIYLHFFYFRKNGSYDIKLLLRKLVFKIEKLIKAFQYLEPFLKVLFSRPSSHSRLFHPLLYPPSNRCILESYQFF